MSVVPRFLQSFFQKLAFRRPCPCTRNPLQNDWQGIEEISVGCDTSNGRYGDVIAQVCPCCKFIWLHYHVEYEGFSRSGRWYRGRIPEKNLSAIKPEEAVVWLERANPCFYGGSYFKTEGELLKHPKGNIRVDL